MSRALNVVVQAAQDVQSGLSISDFADIATAAGIFVALVSTLLAFRTYDDAQAAARRAHMHALFGDYLKLVYERELDAGKAASGKSFSTIKLYTMEEIFEWIQLETRLAGPQWFRLWRADQKRLDYIECWRRTLLVHLSQDPGALASNIKDNRACYSRTFLDFASLSPELSKALAAVSP